MPTASRAVRKIRRIKRERSIAFRMLDLVTNQRNDARMVAHGIEQELKKYIKEYGQLTPDEPTTTQPVGTNSVADQLAGETIGYVDAKV